MKRYKPDHEHRVNWGPGLKAFPRYSERKELGWQRPCSSLASFLFVQVNPLNIVIDPICIGLQNGSLFWGPRFTPFPSLSRYSRQAHIPHKLINDECILSKQLGQSTLN